MLHTSPSPVTANALLGRKPGYQKAVTVGSQREQGAPADVFWHAILVVGDDRPFPPPRQVAASDPADHRADVATEVQQRQILERHRSPFGERG